MDPRVEPGEMAVRRQAAVELPPSLERRQPIDNPKRKEPDSIPGWREIEFDGVKGKVTSEMVAVEVDGVKSKVRILVADFRATGDERQNVVVNFTGFPGMNEGVRGEFLRGEFDKPGGRASLDIDGFARAARERGLLFIPELQVLPVDRRNKRQTFRTDAKIILTGVEQVMKKKSTEPMKPLVESDQVSLIGYSNGAGEAGATAAELSGLMKEKSGVILRMYSLTGIVPVPDMMNAFGKEVWSIAMLEVAARYKNIYGVDFDTDTMAGQEALLSALVEMLKTGDGRQKFIAEVKKSLKGGQERGNLQIGIGLINKIGKDVAGLFPHMQKYDNPDYLPQIGPNVEVELVLPKYDRVFRDKMHWMLLEGARNTKSTEEVLRIIAETKIGEPLPIIPGKWWRGLLPNVGKLRMAALGVDVADLRSTHTGVVASSQEFINAELVEY